jgi:uncharacterized membrane protein YfcA
MELTWLHLAELLVLGALAGGAGSMLGIGGGLIITPVLTLAFGIPIHQAIATSLCCVIATSTGAAARYVELRLSDVRLGMTLELATTIGAVGGSLVAGFLSREALAILFAALLTYAGSSMVRRTVRQEETAGSESLDYTVKRLPLGMVGSGVAGVISGLLGVGGGVVKVPLMYLMMGIPFKVATATSNFTIGVTAAASAFIYYARGDMRPVVAAPTAVGVFLGASLGAHLMRRTPSRWLIIAFSVIVFYFAATMVWKATQGGFSR